MRQKSVPVREPATQVLKNIRRATRRRGNRLYRYYVSTGVIKRGPEACVIRRVPAAEIEAAVIDQVRSLVGTPEIIVRAWRTARRHDSITENEVRHALAEFNAVWDELFPAEQARLIQLLVERVEVKPDGLTIRLRSEGLASLTTDLRQRVAA